MEWHNQSLSVFESWQRYQDNLPDNSFFKLPDPQPPAYYIQAFLDGDLAWTEYAYDDHELQNLKNDAVSCGFTFTVEEIN